MIAGQGVRAAGCGFTTVLLGPLLAARGFNSLQAGVVLAALIAGTALASLAVGVFADRLGRRRCYADLCDQRYQAGPKAWTSSCAAWP